MCDRLCCGRPYGDRRKFDPSNEIRLHIGPGVTPSLVVNGQEIADKISPNWSLVSVDRSDERTAEAVLSVEFVVDMP